MVDATQMTVTAGKDEFYPTPDSLVDRMLSGMDFRMIGTVLEPSAGKGDLIRGFLTKRWKKLRYDGGEVSVDACEVDPYLRQICKYNFSRDAFEKERKRLHELDRVSYYSLTPEEQVEKKALEEKKRERANDDCVRIVHDDFFTYRGWKQYDLILMNPPFSNGAMHLLKAIELQERGGAIVCLLNAETLRNPYTAARQLLAKKLQQYEAQIEFVDDAFRDAERKAMVDVAIVRVHIPAVKDESDIWERMKKAEAERAMPDPELEALVSGDYIEQAIQLYNTEVAATLELVRQYKALTPYIQSSLTAEHDYQKAPIVSLRVGDHAFELNNYMRAVRLKYWTALFSNKKFTGRLTSKLAETYRKTVDKMADYEFSAFNIRQVAAEMNEKMAKGIEDEIVALFDKLSEEHSWYPECSNNRHYYTGWATNKAHKIGKKVILPTSLKSWYSSEAFDLHTAYAFLSDIEKTLDYLDAKPMSDGYNLEARLHWALDAKKTRNIDLKYFDVDIYKKGTVHIKFHPDAMPIVDRLNIYASRKKGWLPPSYGKADYSNMDVKEREVVDSFHGDGSEGSGASAYADVMDKSDFYLAEPARRLPALAAHEEV